MRIYEAITELAKLKEGWNSKLIVAAVAGVAAFGGGLRDTQAQNYQQSSSISKKMSAEQIAATRISDLKALNYLIAGVKLTGLAGHLTSEMRKKNLKLDKEELSDLEEVFDWGMFLTNVADEKLDRNTTTRVMAQTMMQSDNNLKNIKNADEYKNYYINTINSGIDQIKDFANSTQTPMPTKSIEAFTRLAKSNTLIVIGMPPPSRQLSAQEIANNDLFAKDKKSLTNIVDYLKYFNNKFDLKKIDAAKFTLDDAKQLALDYDSFVKSYDGIKSPEIKTQFKTVLEKLDSGIKDRDSLRYINTYLRINASKYDPSKLSPDNLDPEGAASIKRFYNSFFKTYNEIQTPEIKKLYRDLLVKFKSKIDQYDIKIENIKTFSNFKTDINGDIDGVKEYLNGSKTFNNEEQYNQFSRNFSSKINGLRSTLADLSVSKVLDQKQYSELKVAVDFLSSTKTELSKKMNEQVNQKTIITNKPKNEYPNPGLPSTAQKSIDFKLDQLPSASQYPTLPEVKQTTSKVGFDAKTTGKGTGLTKNGDMYTGEWLDGLANGHGERTLVNKGYSGNLVKTGNKIDTQWKNGVPVDGAAVKVTTPDGKSHQGRIKRTDTTPWNYMIVK